MMWRTLGVGLVVLAGLAVACGGDGTADPPDQAGGSGGAGETGGAGGGGGDGGDGGDGGNAEGGMGGGGGMLPTDEPTADAEFAGAVGRASGSEFTMTFSFGRALDQQPAAGTEHTLEVASPVRAATTP